MERVAIKDKVFKPFISEDELQRSIQIVASKINQDFSGKSPLFLGILNGSFMFASDLLKSIDLECAISFVKVASYVGTSSTGKVNELIGLSEEIEGKDIIIIEDIVDTGNTIEKLFDLLSDKNVNSVSVATLLYKPEAYKKNHEIKYIGLEIPNEFVLGYGLDYDGLGRNLSSIYILDEGI